MGGWVMVEVEGEACWWWMAAPEETRVGLVARGWRWQGSGSLARMERASLQGWRG